ncbi:MAG TPA: Sec-independent protein translocase TatB [Actinotalea sp.]|nr:Sec-independent protein translocase TatB [Actinotalea sp.]
MPISGNELLILLVIAAFLIGPERLPGYAEQVSRFVRQARQMVKGAQSQIAEELGPEYKDVDWRQFDPRQYDPRRIVREALMEDLPATSSVKRPSMGAAAAAGMAAVAGSAAVAGGAASAGAGAHPARSAPDGAAQDLPPGAVQDAVPATGPGAADALLFAETVPFDDEAT